MIKGDERALDGNRVVDIRFVSEDEEAELPFVIARPDMGLEILLA